MHFVLGRPRSSFSLAFSLSRSPRSTLLARTRFFDSAYSLGTRGSFRCGGAEGPNPCFHDGVCVQQGFGFNCQCPEGYSGPTCARGGAEFDVCDTSNPPPVGQIGSVYDGTLGDGYDNSQDCGPITIRAPAGQQVALTFIQFELEANFDFVYVDALTFTGDNNPGVLLSTVDSTGNHSMQIRFTSDGSVTRGGFLGSWTFQEPVAVPENRKSTQKSNAFARVSCFERVH